MGTGEGSSKAAVTARLRKASAELTQLEKLFKSESVKIDVRALHEFRRAVDNVRLTAYAAEDWLARRYQPRAPSALLPLLATERLRRLIQLCNDVAADLAATDVTIETPGVPELFRAVVRLQLRLASLIK